MNGIKNKIKTELKKNLFKLLAEVSCVHPVHVLNI